jgi:hypothetical protein
MWTRQPCQSEERLNVLHGAQHKVLDVVALEWPCSLGTVRPNLASRRPSGMNYENGGQPLFHVHSGRDLQTTRRPLIHLF